MKKKIIFTTLVIVAASAVVLAGRSGDRNATGRITSMSVQSPICHVKGITEKGSLWLGYTVYWNDGSEQDYEPVKVKGDFSKTLSYNALKPDGVKKVTVCLWRYKVSAKQCAKERGGDACIYCRRNGCHMEDRIDCKEAGQNW